MDEAAQNASPWLRTAAFSAAGLLLLGGLVWAYGEGGVGPAVAGAHPGMLAAALAVFCLQIPILALRWWWVLQRLGIQARFGDILAAHSGAAVTNFFLPGHFGEAVLSVWLGKTRRAPGVEAFTALVACKVLTLLVSLGMLVAGLLATQSEVLAPLRLPVVGALVLGVAAFGALLVFGGRGGPGTGGLAAKVERARGTLRSLGQDPGALAIGTGLTVLNAFGLCLVLGLVYGAVGAPLTAMDTVLLRAVDTIGHVFSGWIPGNLGIDEAVLTVTSHHGLGVEAPLAFTSALLHKGLVVLYVGLCGLVFLGLGTRR